MDLSLSPEDRAFQAEARDWLTANVEAPPGAFADLDEEVAWGRRWQAKLAAARWVGLPWPERYGGRGTSWVQVALFNLEYARAEAPQPVNRVGLNLAGPTLLAHGTEDQKRRWLPAILTAQEIWCQLFSEPDAGSDLRGGLRTEARRVADGWRLTGQKVWTSYARQARWGICLARTDPGLLYLVVDMHRAGIELRPLVQMTGEADFNQVFLDDVFVPAEHLVGRAGEGWTVANTTLAHERGTSFPFKEQVVHEVLLVDLVQEARKRGIVDDPRVADALIRSWVEVRLLRLHNWRTLTRLARGEVPGPESSLVKLAWSETSQNLADRALHVLGPGGMLTDSPWCRQALWSRAASIAGGTSEIQRTIIAERLLGLPREPSPG